jgi:N-acetylmuramoyl-L-alanine amidase
VIKLLGSRGAAAVMGMLMLALGSSEAAAQAFPVNFDLKAVQSVDVDQSAKPLGSPAAAMLQPAIARTTTAAVLGNGTIVQAQPARSVTMNLTQSIAREAAWLYKGGWPLYALVDKFATNAPLDEQTNCLATAVYFEARGESAEGQLAVARVVMNRASSGRYPTDWCSVVKQPAQFSFVRNGQFPQADTNCQAWRRAEAVAELAVANIVPSLGNDVLWYHADYVAPSWGQRLNVVQKIGAHIFYRAA